MLLRHQLPEIYSNFFSSKLLEWDPRETKATCNSCVNVPKYKPNLKCCTFHPFQPNYLIGGLLKTGRISVGAKNQIKTKIKSRLFVLPIGIVAPLDHQVEFNHRKEGEFGQREDWLCPYYDKEQNHCGIWKFRGAVCTSFYCKSSHGKKGEILWERMSDYLTYVEAALMEEALVQLDFSPRQISDNLAYLNRFDATEEELKSRSLPLKLAREIWNGYFEEQEEFFMKCFEIVSGMSQKQFREAMGEQGAGLEKDLLSALRKI